VTNTLAYYSTELITSVQYPSYWLRLNQYSLDLFLKPREKIKKAENLEFVLSKEGWKGIYYQSQIMDMKSFIILDPGFFSLYFRLCKYQINLSRQPLLS